jgi:hypothetical protein
MPLTAAQLADEQRKEREYNKLFETVIKYTPFKNWYPLMIGASRLVTGTLKKRVGVDESGRPIVVYKTDVGKVLGVWAKPTHESIARDFARGKYGKGILNLLLPIDHIKDLIQQKSKKNIIFDISPDEVKQVYAAKQNKPAPVTVNNKPTVLSPTVIKQKARYSFNNY